MIELWELHGEDDRRFSNFSWRARMALRHKQLDVSYRPVLLTDKAAIAFSGGRTVPVIRDGEAVVRDSWAIALGLALAGVASDDGTVALLDAQSGRDIWRIGLKSPIAAG